MDNFSSLRCCLRTEAFSFDGWEEGKGGEAFADVYRSGSTDGTR